MTNYSTTRTQITQITAIGHLPYERVPFMPDLAKFCIYIYTAYNLICSLLVFKFPNQELFQSPSKIVHSSHLSIAGILYNLSVFAWLTRVDYSLLTP